MVIVVAGMEGALPSVVGGLVKVPVIAVPTSVGYGASFGGLAALLGMLNSCAPGCRWSISTTVSARPPLRAGSTISQTFDAYPAPSAHSSGIASSIVVDADSR